MARGAVAQGKRKDSKWDGDGVRKARAHMSQFLGKQVCPHCGRVVDESRPWVVGHIISRGVRPDLMWDPTNWRLEHRSCSDATGQAGVIAKAKAEALAGTGQSVFASGSDGPQTPPLTAHTHDSDGPAITRDDLSWDHFVQVAPEWYSDLLGVPANANPPLYISPPHPDATGSLGWQAIKWVEESLNITLRWWQRLAFVHELEHDCLGRLVWKITLESGPRRIGKSVRLRGSALWRISGDEDFGEVQTVVHTGKDLGIVTEIHRLAWAWAEARGWKVSKGVSTGLSISRDENRWMVKSTEMVYGFDVTRGMVDEAWAVEPMAFEEGLEPATMERISPQLLLTSTAHRRATKLMKNRLRDILAEDDGETLVLLWGAPPGADPSLLATWKAASPHWTPEREQMIRKKYAKAASGEQDAEFDDVDPMEGFLAQYLNVWQFTAKKIAPGEALVTDTAWSALTVDTIRDSTPDAMAVESWFNMGVSVASAWRLPDGRVVVSVTDYPDLPAASAAVALTPPRGPVQVGATLADDPAWKVNKVRVEAASMTTLNAAVAFGRMLTDGTLVHDGSEALTEQVLAVRTRPSTNGPNLVSKARADAVKAATWAAQVAAKKRGKPVVPSRYKRDAH